MADPLEERLGANVSRSRSSRLLLRRVWGFVARLFSPDYSWCKRCRRPWTVAREHSTYYQQGSGCFPLCRSCWGDLTPAQRLPFYESLVDSWEAEGRVSGLAHLNGVAWPTLRQRVRNAVLDGG